MRTLKKSLALVLALVMLLGLGVVGASADNALDNYTDADEIGDAYLEAVGVLTGLGIVDGMTETTIVPQATYTRAQAAKIITTMVLGVNGAKSCVASYAPFDDVAANHWAAGYIAFCKEQGIIDGVTDTTFDPEGTLTGYQWAKMLLAAVGFNANNELEGSSWSLNTARIGREVGLFDGDLAGADHTPLRREQAMLYAFNTLTKVGQVVYSEALGDYIYKYTNADRYTPECTLGWSVFKLSKVEGIVTDNEGMGNKTTTLGAITVPAADKVTNKTTASIKADTGLDLYRHAVRVWYVGNNYYDGKSTAVYVVDLAKTTEFDCYAYEGKDYNKLIAGYKDDGYSVSDIYKVGVGDKNYEVYVIDNSAYGEGKDEINLVSFNYTYNTLGVRSNNLGEKDYTTISDYGQVVNSKIMTDISSINRGDKVLVLKTTNDADAVYYVYAVGATAGNVVDYKSDGTITLSDGTVLTPSVLSVVTNLDEAGLIAALRSPAHSAPAYSFVLDTHGHYISYSNSAYMTVAYYTDAWKVSNPGAWSTNVAYIAQFVDVATGEVEEIPVTADWKAWAKEGGYYDITDELYGDATYAPHAVFDATIDGNFNYTDGATYGAYAYVASETFKATSSKVGDYRYDYNSVEYIIVSDAGDDITVDHYTGNAALIDAYKDKYDDGVSSVTLTDIAVLTTAGTGTNTRYATVIFAYDGADTLAGGIAFFPKDVTSWGVQDNTFYNVMAYLNGAEVASKINVTWSDLSIEAGFYNYTIDDATGRYVLSAIDEGTSGIVLGTNAVENAGTLYWLHDGDDEYDLPSDTTVVDLRSEGNRPSTISGVADLVNTNTTETDAYNLAYVVNQAGVVQYIYVVDANYYTVTVKYATEAKYDATLIKGMPTESDSYTVSVWAEQPKTIDFNFGTSETALDFNNGNGYYLVLDVNGTQYNVEPSAISVTATGTPQTVTVNDFAVTGNMVVTVIGFDEIPAAN